MIVSEIPVEHLTSFTGSVSMCNQPINSENA